MIAWPTTNTYSRRWWHMGVCTAGCVYIKFEYCYSGGKNSCCQDNHELHPTDWTRKWGMQILEENFIPGIEASYYTVPTDKQRYRPKVKIPPQCDPRYSTSYQHHVDSPSLHGHLPSARGVRPSSQGLPTALSGCVWIDHTRLLHRPPRPPTHHADAVPGKTTGRGGCHGPTPSRLCWGHNCHQRNYNIIDIIIHWIFNKTMWAIYFLQLHVHLLTLWHCAK